MSVVSSLASLISGRVSFMHSLQRLGVAGNIQQQVQEYRAPFDAGKVCRRSYHGSLYYKSPNLGRFFIYVFPADSIQRASWVSSASLFVINLSNTYNNSYMIPINPGASLKLGPISFPYNIFAQMIFPPKPFQLSQHNTQATLPDDEKLLFSLIATGDERAFETLFNLYLSRLYPFIIKFTRSEQAAQEIIQKLLSGYGLTGTS